MYSSPSILMALRSEIDAVVREATTPSSHPPKLILDLQKIISECPLLSSTFKELLRYYTHTVTSRAVLSDILLSDRYHLRKGSILCIPGATVHFNPQVWGLTHTSSSRIDFCPIKREAKGADGSGRVAGLGRGRDDLSGEAFCYPGGDGGVGDVCREV